MILRIDSDLRVAIYLQINQQIKHAVASGALRPNDLLPPVRKLAAELRINPTTVAHAYRNLEREGILRTVRGGGSYVKGESQSLPRAERLRRLKPLTTQLAVEAKQLRLPCEDLLRLLEESYAELA
jgi:GntR family transcriptional regulator